MYGVNEGVAEDLRSGRFGAGFSGAEMLENSAAQRADSPDGAGTIGNIQAANPYMVASGVNVHYGDNHAIRNVSLEIGKNEVIALIGPSGCGKTTFLRCLNRMNDTIESARVTGEITLDGHEIHDKSLDVVALRARVGMVFQKPNPFPKSIYDNIAYGPKIHGLTASKGELDEVVETSLISPDSPAGIKAGGIPQETRDWFMKRTPLGRPGEPEDIAGAVLMLCAAQSSFVNGTHLLVDGGLFQG